MTAVEELGLRRGELALFCRRHGVRRLAVFGSALRDEQRPDSDLDLLVEFEPGRAQGLLEIAKLELELGQLIGREVQMRTINDLSAHFRDKVQDEAAELYAA